MPHLIKKNGDMFWFITCYDGPWQVYSSATYSTDMIRSAWGIVNILDGKHREIGKPTAARSRSKINYYDKSCEKARELNAEYRASIMKDTLGYNRQDLREDIISTLNFCLTAPTATCYGQGVPGMVRRLEAISAEASATLERLHEKDEKDWQYAGIPSMWALLKDGGDIDLRKS